MGGGELVAGHHQRPPGRGQVGERQSAGEVSSGPGERVGDQVADPALRVGPAQHQAGHRLRRGERLLGRVQELAGQRTVRLQSGGEHLFGAEEDEGLADVVPDDLWERMAPLLPPAPERRHRHPGRLRVSDRVALAGVLFVLRTGVAWRDVPAETVGCSGVTAWRRLRDWTEAGV